MLNANPRSLSESTSRAQQHLSPFQVQRGLDTCFDEIRTLPGFERYMQSPSIAEMIAAAADLSGSSDPLGLSQASRNISDTGMVSRNTWLVS